MFVAIGELRMSDGVGPPPHNGLFALPAMKAFAAADPVHGLPTAVNAYPLSV